MSAALRFLPVKSIGSTVGSFNNHDGLGGGGLEGGALVGGSRSGNSRPVRRAGKSDGGSDGAASLDDRGGPNIGVGSLMMEPKRPVLPVAGALDELVDSIESFRIAGGAEEDLRSSHAPDLRIISARSRSESVVRTRLLDSR